MSRFSYSVELLLTLNELKRQSPKYTLPRALAEHKQCCQAHAQTHSNVQQLPSALS